MPGLGAACSCRERSGQDSAGRCTVEAPALGDRFPKGGRDTAAQRMEIVRTGAQKVRSGPAALHQPRLPSHGLHRHLSFMRVRQAAPRCNVPVILLPIFLGWGTGGGGDLVRENFCPEKFSAGKIPPQSLKVMGKMAPHFSMVKGEA